MEHFRVLLGQQKEAILKDVAENNSLIIALEKQLDDAKEANKRANSELRSITKRLEKLF